MGTQTEPRVHKGTVGTQSKIRSVLTNTEAQTESPQKREEKEKGQFREQDPRIGNGVAQAGFVSSLLREDDLAKRQEAAERNWRISRSRTNR